MKRTKSLQPLRYGIYCIARRALKLITKQLQYGIYCIAIVVLKLWATTSGIYCIVTECQTIQIVNYVRNCLHRNVALILSTKLSNYGRNFLHRRVVLNLFIYLFIFVSGYGRNLLRRHITLNLITNIHQLHEI